MVGQLDLTLAMTLVAAVALVVLVVGEAAGVAVALVAHAVEGLDAVGGALRGGVGGPHGGAGRGVAAVTAGMVVVLGLLLLLLLVVVMGFLIVVVHDENGERTQVASVLKAK